MAHEIRNPLSVMRNASYFLQDRLTDGDKDTKEALGEIFRALDNSERIVDELFDYGRGRIPQPSRFLLEEAIDAALEMVKPPVGFEEKVERILEHERLSRLMGRLSPREETVLRFRFGFDDGEARSLAATGERLGVSRERIRQIEKKALERLKRYIELAEAGTKFDDLP